MKLRNYRSGFTLIELLIVMVIIGILATLGLVAYTQSLQNARNSRRIGDIKSISAALEQYYTTNSGVYPGAAYNSSSGIANTSYFPNGTLPSDPLDTAPYTYNFPVGQQTATSYCVCAQLEGTPPIKAANSTASCGAPGAAASHYCMRQQQ